MNYKEFTALKVGDKIENAMTHGEGVVSKVVELRSDRAVSVKWGASHPPHGGMEFSYATHSTAWMHWNKVEDDDANKNPADYGLDNGNKP